MAQIDPSESNVAQTTVTELVSALKRTLEDNFGYVRVGGEISGFRGPHTSGHAYFALKDEAARLDAVIWRTTYARLKVKPQDGLEVIATGRITTFPSKSSYQIVVESLELAGIGSLMALLDARRRQLSAEGLFSQDRKKSLPFLPRVIGVITSPTGAVIRDIIHRIADRFPSHVLVWPVRVQGETSANEIAAGIKGMNALAEDATIPRPDVLIVARGGGSLEDLWSFNEGEVVRAAAESAIPLISAVGHETDWTLLDYAADVRAPTPTAAAEICVPLRTALVSNIEQLKLRGMGSAVRIQEQGQTRFRSALRGMNQISHVRSSLGQRLDAVSDALQSLIWAKFNVSVIRSTKISVTAAKHSPAVRVFVASERLRTTEWKLGSSHKAQVDAASRRFFRLNTDVRMLVRKNQQRDFDSFKAVTKRWELNQTSADRFLTAVSAQITRASGSLRRAIFRASQQKAAEAAKFTRLFGAVNYTAVLQRGFAVILDNTGAPVTRSEEAKKSREITIRFVDGDIAASVGRAKKSAPKAKIAAQQHELF